MRAYSIDRFGAPQVLSLVEKPVPLPGSGEILIRTKAIGLNFAEIFARLGYYPGLPDLPFVPGIELSGVIETTGPGVRGWRKGDRVLAFTRQGAYAEYVCVPVSQITRMPKHMGFQDAAALGVTSLTAYHAIVTLAHATRGEMMLLHAAGGGVGTIALQLARHLGLKVFATVGAESKRELVASLGADTVINYREEDFTTIVKHESDGYGVDIVLDSVGGRIFRKGWKLLAPMGRYVLYGFAAVADREKVGRFKAFREAAAVPLIYPPSIVSKNVSLMGFNLYFLGQKTEYLHMAMKYLLRLYERKAIRPVIGAGYPFERMVDAHRFLQSRESVGKVVVNI